MVAVVLAVALIGCGRPDEEAPGAALEAFVTIPPQAYFVERVGGEHVEVGVLVGAGQNPHMYEPTPKQMAALAEADVYFLIGVPFEDVLRDRIRAVNPDMRMVETGRGIDLRSMETGHAHEHEEEHGHHFEAADPGAKDPHVWLDPNNAKTMARNIGQALIDLDPAHETDYRARLQALVEDLDELDAEIRAIRQGMERDEFMVFHPAFGYFADAYGLEQVPVEIEGKQPSARELAGLIERARQQDIRVIFVQEQFSREYAEVVAREIGGSVVALDPLARDYMQNMKRIARALAEASR
jgi:zinc transport system substrate-binding protein